MDRERHREWLLWLEILEVCSLVQLQRMRWSGAESAIRARARAAGRMVFDFDFEFVLCALWGARPTVGARFRVFVSFVRSIHYIYSRDSEPIILY